MAEVTELVEPFCEVRLQPLLDGRVEVVARLRYRGQRAEAAAGLALDGSASMKGLYGHVGSRITFASASGKANVIEPIARRLAEQLVGFAASDRVRLIYWSCGPDGSQTEEIGEVGLDALQNLSLRGPKSCTWGRGTKLLPPLRYFFEVAFPAAKELFLVFLTDGIIEDLDAVKEYSRQLADEIVSQKRTSLRLLLLGIGEEVDELQMEELDDLFEGSDFPIELWDHKLVSEMRGSQEVFAEVLSQDAPVYDWGRIVDAAGAIVREFPNGLQGLIRFTLPSTATEFTLEYPFGKATQSLRSH